MAYLLVTNRMTVQSLGNISGRTRILNTVKICRRKSWKMQGRSSQVKGHQRALKEREAALTLRLSLLKACSSFW